MSLRIAAALLATTTAVAHAETFELTLAPSCAEIDATTDLFSQEERSRALGLFTRALEQQNLLVVNEGCVDRYKVSHAPAGDEVIIIVSGPQGMRRMKHGTLEGLSRHYTRMIGSLIHDRPKPKLTTASPEPERAPEAATEADADPERETVREAVATPMGEFTDAAETADSDEDTTAESPRAGGIIPTRVVYAQLGLGTGGSAYGLGYRRQFDSGELDIALQGTDSFTGVSIEGLKLVTPNESASFYYGGGFSFASDHTVSGDAGGVRVELTTGVELARKTDWRAFVQLDIGLPLYEVTQNYGGNYTMVEWHPTALLSLGVGR